jgi:hypothetical protein
MLTFAVGSSNGDLSRRRREVRGKHNSHFRLKKADKPAIKRQYDGCRDRAKRLAAARAGSPFYQFSLGSIVIAGAVRGRNRPMPLRVGRLVNGDPMED